MQTLARQGQQGQTQGRKQVPGRKVPLRVPARRPASGRGLSNEVAAEGIRVNSVSPGVVDTDMVYPQAQELAEHSPLGRMGRPEEIADAVSWLVSPEASFVTGSDITISGGR